jgi:competence protein ComGC
MTKRAISGFTLLELLSAMGVLVILVLMMSRVFTETNRVWNLGTKRVVEAQEARVIMDFLVQGLSTIVSDGALSFRMHSEPGTESLSVRVYGEDTDSVAFLAYTQTPPWGATGNHATDQDYRRRATSQFVYYADYMVDDTGDPMDFQHPEGPRYRLVRKRGTRSPHTVDDNPRRSPPGAGLLYSAYHRNNWWLPDNVADHQPETVANNLVAFEFWAYTAAGRHEYDFDSTRVGEPPLWVDLYIELMGDAEIAQLAQMWKINHPEWRDFRERNARRYSARIYLRNREGYLL